MVELLHADCMEYMSGLPDKAFDLAIVDPPYGIDINSSGRLGHCSMTAPGHRACALPAAQAGRRLFVAGMEGWE